MKKKLSLETKRKVYCAIHGHSNIHTIFWGYVSCARCGVQVGDTMAGNYQNKKAVIVGHKCVVCNKNAKQLTKSDKAYITKKVLAEIGVAK